MIRATYTDSRSTPSTYTDHASTSAGATYTAHASQLQHLVTPGSPEKKKSNLSLSLSFLWCLGVGDKSFFFDNDKFSIILL